MENLDDFHCESAVNEFYNNKKISTPIVYIEHWLLKHTDLRQRVLANNPLAGKPSIRIGETVIPGFRNENVEHFFLLYRNIIDLPKYHKLASVAEQAVVEYDNVVSSANREDVIEEIKNWLTKYEQLGTKELLSFYVEDTEDIESSFAKCKNLNIHINKDDFKPISRFNKIFNLEYFENALMPDRMNLFISTPSNQPIA